MPKRNCHRIIPFVPSINRICLSWGGAELYRSRKVGFLFPHIVKKWVNLARFWHGKGGQTCAGATLAGASALPSSVGEIIIIKNKTPPRALRSLLLPRSGQQLNAGKRSGYYANELGAALRGVGVRAPQISRSCFQCCSPGTCS